MQHPVQDIIFDSVPTTPEEFTTLRDRVATTPAGGAAMLVLAMQIYMRDEHLGLICLMLVTDMKHISPDPNGLSRARAGDWNQRVRGHPHIAPSYIVGTTTATGYALPPLPWTVRVDNAINNPHASKTDAHYKVFIACTGASSQRPVTLAKNDKGIWKLEEWSSVQVGVAKPGPGPDPL